MVEETFVQCVFSNDNDNAGKVVVGGGSEKKTNFMEPTVVSGVKLDDPLMKVLDKQTKSKDVKKR